VASLSFGVSHLNTVERLNMRSGSSAARARREGNEHGGHQYHDAAPKLQTIHSLASNVRDPYVEIEAI